MIKPMLKVLRFLYSVYAILLFVILMFAVFPFALLFSTFVKKSNGTVYTTYKIWAIVWYVLIFVRHKRIYLSPPPDKKRRYIFVANHCSYIDIPQLLRATRQPVRVLGRHDLAKIPVFGTIYKSMTILVNRDSSQNRVKSFAEMKNALSGGTSVFIFPEGYFNETGKPLKAFYDGAFRLSMDSNTPIVPVIFPDTVKRLNYKSIFSFTPGISRSVFLKEINPSSFGTDIHGFKQAVFNEMQQALLQYGRKNES